MGESYTAFPHHLSFWVLGDPRSGQTTLAQQLSDSLGVVLISPLTIMEFAKQYESSEGAQAADPQQQAEVSAVLAHPDVGQHAQQAAMVPLIK